MILNYHTNRIANTIKELEKLSIKLYFILNTIITSICLLGVFGEKENEHLRKCLTILTYTGMAMPMIYILILSLS